MAYIIPIGETAYYQFEPGAVQQVKICDHKIVENEVMYWIKQMDSAINNQTEYLVKADTIHQTLNSTHQDKDEYVYFKDPNTLFIFEGQVIERTASTLKVRVKYQANTVYVDVKDAHRTIEDAEAAYNAKLLIEVEKYEKEIRDVDATKTLYNLVTFIYHHPVLVCETYAQRAAKKAIDNIIKEYDFDIQL